MRKRWSFLFLLAGTLILSPIVGLAQEAEEPPKEEAAAEAVQPLDEPMPAEGESDHDHAAHPADHPAGPHDPPGEGQWIREHWTPYDPPDPAAYPEDSRIHIIVQGDTLWDLSTAFLGDPLLWPQLWDQNRYILDSHWIYPGDPLLVPGVPTVISEEEAMEEAEIVEEVVEEAEEEIAEMDPAEEAPPPEPVDVQPILAPGEPIDTTPTAMEQLPVMTGPELLPVASATDLYCSSYLIQSPEIDAPTIAQRAEAAKTMLSPPDIVFIDRGMAENVLPGGDYKLVRVGQEVKHPATKKPAGYLLHQVGRLKVIASQDHSSTAMVYSSCSEILVGDLLIPYEEIPVPLSAGAPLELYEQEFAPDKTGFIVWGQRNTSFGEGDAIEIDMGQEHGLEPGDYLTIFRDYREANRFFSIRTGVEAPKEKELLKSAGQYPPDVVGQIVILRVGEKSATAMIVESLREVYIGDKVSKL